MRIKKITPTNEYKHIEFGALKDDHLGRYIYTPMGFQPVLAFEFIKTGRSLLLCLSNGEELICDPGHIVQTSSGPKFAKEINNTDTLVGYNGSVVDVLVSKGPEIDLYDIEIPSPHWYYTAGVLSHNSLMLANNAIHAVLAGHDVLFVTFELSTLKTALRIAASITGVDMNKFYSSNVEEMAEATLAELRFSQDKVRTQLKSRSKFGKNGKRGELVIYELPPDECSVDDVYGIVDRNRRLRGWQPKVIVLDYLELMMSRHGYSNKEGDYTRQKSVATEVRGLAKNENVLVYTANQTNRSAIKDNGQPIDVDKSAESFGKNMPVDYVISMNQTEAEYTSGAIRLWVAKNRNGPKFTAVHTRVNYQNMRILEVQ